MGTSNEYGEYFDDEKPEFSEHRDVRSEMAERHGRHIQIPARGGNTPTTPTGDEPELAVDVYQTPDDIIVRALVAGVPSQNLNIDLTREMLTVTGSRQDEKVVEEEHYFQRELYWGSFSRTIMLPEEVDVDIAEATESHGVLTIRLPKINKKKQTKLKVRSR